MSQPSISQRAVDLVSTKPSNERAVTVRKNPDYLPRVSDADAAEAVAVILSAYTRDDVPKGFVAQAEAVLTGYPYEVVGPLVDARSPNCIQRKNVFRPHVAEISQACEAQMDHLRRVYDAGPPIAARPEVSRKEPREQRKTYQELVDLCAKDGLHIGPKERTAHRVTSAENDAILAKYGFTPEVLAALPNAKPRQEPMQPLAKVSCETLGGEK